MCPCQGLNLWYLSPCAIFNLDPTHDLCWGNIDLNLLSDLRECFISKNFSSDANPNGYVLKSNSENNERASRIRKIGAQNTLTQEEDNKSTNPVIFYVDIPPGMLSFSLFQQLHTQNKYYLTTTFLHLETVFKPPTIFLIWVESLYLIHLKCSCSL